MILRVGLAVDVGEKELTDQLVAWSVGSAGDGDVEVDLALIRDDFGKLAGIYPRLDMAFISYGVLRAHREELLELQRSNPRCLPVPVGGPAEELRQYLDIRPGGLLTRPWRASEVAGLCRSCARELDGSKDVLQLRTRSGCHALSAQSVLYCQSDRKYVSLVPDRGEALRKLGKLDDLAAELPDFFVRLHQSFLVNSRRVTALDKVSWEVVLDSGDRLPVSRAYRPAAAALFQKCLLDG